MTYYLGIDPGLSEVGFGIIQLQNGQPIFVDCGIIKTKPTSTFGDRLTIIKNDLKTLLTQHHYSAVGMEELFFVKNVTNGIKVAHARGVLYEEVSSRGLPIYEFTPKEIKSNICGDGQADKTQVQLMIQRILQLSHFPKPHDAADALGIAILTSRLHKP